jgi:hypothetical protein
MNREQIGKLAKASALIREAQSVVGALVDASQFWLRLDDVQAECVNKRRKKAKTL